MEMKTKRSLYPQAQLSLFMPLLAFLSPTVSLVAVMMFLSDRENSTREFEIPLRLLTATELAQVLDPASSPSIMIQEDDEVKFNGRTFDKNWSKELPELRTMLRAHSNKPDAAKIVIVMDPQARYERLIDVLNALAACKCSRYQISLSQAQVTPRPA
ncbi:hypothetical protein BH11VER1_BH11VER1_38130 [soil metagenome]